MKDEKDGEQTETSLKDLEEEKSKSLVFIDSPFGKRISAVAFWILLILLIVMAMIYVK